MHERPLVDGPGARVQVEAVRAMPNQETPVNAARRLLQLRWIGDPHGHVQAMVLKQLRPADRERQIDVVVPEPLEHRALQESHLARCHDADDREWLSSDEDPLIDGIFAAGKQGGGRCGADDGHRGVGILGAVEPAACERLVIARRQVGVRGVHNGLKRLHARCLHR